MNISLTTINRIKINNKINKNTAGSINYFPLQNDVFERSISFGAKFSQKKHYSYKQKADMVQRRTKNNKCIEKPALNLSFVLPDEKFRRAIKIADKHDFDLLQSLYFAALDVDDKGLERAKKLKNIQVDLNYIPRELLAVIAQEYTDEEVDKALKYINDNSGKYVSYRTFLSIKNMNDKQIEILNENPQKNIELCELTDEQYEDYLKLDSVLDFLPIEAKLRILREGKDAINNIIKLKELGFCDDQMIHFAAVNNEDLKRAIELYKIFNGKSEYFSTISKISQCEKAPQRVKEFVENPSQAPDLLYFPDLMSIDDEKIYKKALMIARADFIFSADIESWARQLKDDITEEEIRLIKDIYKASYHDKENVLSLIQQNKINEKTLQTIQELNQDKIQGAYLLANFEGEQLDVAKKLLENGLRYKSKKIIVPSQIAGLKNDENLDKALKHYKNQRKENIYFSENHFALYASLNTEQLKTATKLYACHINEASAAIWAKTFSKKQLERVFYFASDNLNCEQFIPEIVQLSDEEYQTFINFNKKKPNMPVDASIKIAKLGNDKANTIIDLLNKGTGISEALMLIGLNDDDFNTLVKLFNEEGLKINISARLVPYGKTAIERRKLTSLSTLYSDELTEKIVKMKEEKYQKAKKLFEQGVGTAQAVEFANLTPLQTETALKLQELCLCYSAEDIAAISAKYTGSDKLDEVIYYMKNNASIDTIDEFLSFDEEKKQRLKDTILKRGKSFLNQSDRAILNADKETYERIKKFLDKNSYTREDICNIDFSNFSEEQFNLYMGMYDYDTGMPPAAIQKLLKLDKDKMAKALIFKNIPRGASEIIDFSDEAFKKAIKLQALFPLYSFHEITTLPLLDDERLKRVIRHMSKYRFGIGVYKYIALYINNPEKLKNLPISERIHVKEQLLNAKEDFKSDTNTFEFEIKDINLLVNVIDKSLDNVITPTNSSEEEIKNMMSEFFANNNKETEQVIKTADFKKYGKSGIPLKYPRAKFLEDLSRILNTLSQKEKEETINKLDIQLIEENGSIKGYNGIIDLNKLNRNVDYENKVYEIAHKFIKENEVKTTDEKLNKILNSLIGSMSEFVNIIGKQQYYACHTLSLDLHILQVLQEAMKDSRYDKLSDIDKTALKFAVIMHDISKSEFQTDSAHPNTSSLYAKSILEKYKLPISLKDRVFELIKNHHWLEAYSTKGASPQYIASLFRYKNDFVLEQIITKADLKGVSDEFYLKLKKSLSDENLQNIQNSLSKINSSGQLIFPDKIVKQELIPLQQDKRTGAMYKVINLTALDDDFDLSQYGFVKGTTPKTLRLLVHSVSKASNMDTVSILSNINNAGFLCATYISLKNKKTYMNNFGLSIESQNSNIANASRINQSSGQKKDFERFSKMINQKGKENFRTIIPESIKTSLGLNSAEYEQLYGQISTKKYLTQIKDNEIFTIGDKQLKGSQIKFSVRTACDTLLKNSHEDNNEINVYNPKINAFVAKTDSLEEIPQDYLDYVKKNNLPILIIGD